MAPLARSGPSTQFANTWYWPALRLVGNGQYTVAPPDPGGRNRYSCPLSGVEPVCQGPLTCTETSVVETTSSAASTGTACSRSTSAPSARTTNFMRTAPARLSDLRHASQNRENV